MSGVHRFYPHSVGERGLPVGMEAAAQGAAAAPLQIQGTLLLRLTDFDAVTFVFTALSSMGNPNIGFSSFGAGTWAGRRSWRLMWSLMGLRFSRPREFRRKTGPAAI